MTTAFGGVYFLYNFILKDKNKLNVKNYLQSATIFSIASSLLSIVVLDKISVAAAFPLVSNYFVTIYANFKAA
jgi:hypothetical protein